MKSEPDVQLWIWDEFCSTVSVPLKMVCLRTVLDNWHKRTTEHKLTFCRLNFPPLTIVQSCNAASSCLNNWPINYIKWTLLLRESRDCFYNIFYMSQKPVKLDPIFKGPESIKYDDLQKKVNLMSSRWTKLGFVNFNIIWVDI